MTSHPNEKQLRMMESAAKNTTWDATRIAEYVGLKVEVVRRHVAEMRGGR